MATTSQATIDEIANFSTCDASDALQKLHVPHGGFIAGITMYSPSRQEGPTRVVGPAYTVEYVLNDDADERRPEGHYIDTVPEGSVIVISAPPGVVNAVYGGLMTARAKYSGAVGTVVDGRVRDLEEHRARDFPVFARAVGTAAPAEVVRVSQINEPIALHTENAHATIHPGDVIVADLNGVVCVPARFADELPALMASQAEADGRVAEAVGRGRTFADASGEFRRGVKRPVGRE